MQRGQRLVSHSFERLGTQGRFARFEVEEYIAAVSMLCTDLHAGGIDLERFVDGVAEEPPHFGNGCDFVHPDARKVRFAGGVLWDRSGEIDFAIAGPRYAGVVIIQPLGRGANGQN